MSDAEGKDLTTGPYRDLFIVEGTELSPKQNVENKKEPAKSVAFGTQNDPEDDKDEEEEEVPEISDEEKADLAALVASTIENIEKAESIDALNEISTDVANDDSLCESEEIAGALDAKMFAFLNVEPGEENFEQTEEKEHDESPLDEEEEEVPLAQGKPGKGKKAV